MIKYPLGSGSLVTFTSSRSAAEIPNIGGKIKEALHEARTIA